MGFASEMIVGSVMLLLLSVAVGEKPEWPPQALATWSWVYLIVFGSLLAFNAYMVLLSRVSAALASSYTFVNPVIALALGIWLGGESVTRFEWAAAGVITAGVVLLVLGRANEGDTLMKTLRAILTFHRRAALVLIPSRSGELERRSSAATVAADPRARRATVGGLQGADDSTAAVERELAAFDSGSARRRSVSLIAIPLANPAGATLEFPPSGAAYREHPESHALWRFIGAHAPDDVLIAGDDRAALGAALAAHAPADVGKVPFRSWSASESIADLDAADIGASDARREIERRLARSPRELAEELRVWQQLIVTTSSHQCSRLKLGGRPVRALTGRTRRRQAALGGRTRSHGGPSCSRARGQSADRYPALVRNRDGFRERPDAESMPYATSSATPVFMGSTIVAQAGMTQVLRSRGAAYRVHAADRFACGRALSPPAGRTRLGVVATPRRSASR
jgi:hypothetical protein